VICICISIFAKMFMMDPKAVACSGVTAESLESSVMAKPPKEPEDQKPRPSEGEVLRHMLSTPPKPLCRYAIEFSPEFLHALT